MNKKKLTLKDPEEYALIKKIYFDNYLIKDEIDSQENFDRIDSRIRNNLKNSR
jgi:hypothetical protein